MILEYILNMVNLIFVFSFLGKSRNIQTKGMLHFFVAFLLFAATFCCSSGWVLFQKCISYLCFPSSQLASICCRLGLANSSAMSRRLEKLAPNKSPNPSCFPCLEWWTTLPLIYEMIWEVCEFVRVCVCMCVTVTGRKCAWKRGLVSVSVFYIGYLFMCAGMLWSGCENRAGDGVLCSYGSVK